jgi:CspA family cold shock protein
VSVEARVRFWHDEEGWGVVDAPSTPGGCWAHFSHIDHAGYRSLNGVASVLLDWEEAAQDGYRFTAVRVLVPGRAPASTWSEHPRDGACSSSLTVELDQNPEDCPPGPRIAG